MSWIVLLTAEHLWGIECSVLQVCLFCRFRQLWSTQNKVEQTDTLLLELTGITHTVIYLSTYLSICLSVCLSVCLSICTNTWMHQHRWVYDELVIQECSGLLWFSKAWVTEEFLTHMSCRLKAEHRMCEKATEYGLPEGEWRLRYHFLS